MLVISRRKGQRIVIGDDIELVVTELHRSSVKVGIRAPKGYAVLRGEVRDSIEEANRQAAETALDGVELGEPAAAAGHGGKAPTDLLRIRQPAGETTAAAATAPATETASAGPEIIVRRRPGTPPTGAAPNENKTP